ncbi:MAG: PilZ domain-containing protein [Candidatus Omnitrophica bacterium]|nr:PilZ domain-containing protein [Candidatus Omnitrophota bacterium]MBU3912362.1 PilZ domain-containing protein [Candidatus Omnitrophota bacterium]MBU4149358.1 PilZ domain-containing protein [Candidatus Omnitrophota bacterium]
MIKERRKHLRARKQLPLKIADKSFDVITETVDISPSGIYCRITRLLPVMSKIEVIMLVPVKGNGRQTKKIRAMGVVVRTEPVILKDTDKAHYNVAIFFTEIPKKDRQVIEAYVLSGSTDQPELQIIKN